MPIGDLLASITGEQPSPSPTSATRSGAAVPKRKAVDELRPAPATKAPRTGSPSTASPRPNGSSPRPSPHPADKPAGSRNARPPTNSQRSTNLSSSISRQPSSTSVRNGDKPSPVGKPTSSGKPIPSRPLNGRPVNTDSGPKPEQKKGSFAEILARAKANAELRESFGKIQHKAIEKKPLTMKERKLQKAEEARQIKLASKKQSSSGYAGTGTSARPEAARPGQRPASSSALSKGKDKTPPAPEVKKVKKAALATTGYTGTARPRPGAAATKPGAASRPSREEERERPRYPSAFSRPRRRDEEDDLDDFIDYDEEEEEVGYGRHRFEFDSADDDSDMEAGLSDIDQEERRAERQARLEDLKEIEMEKRLREEKRRRLAGRA